MKSVLGFIIFVAAIIAVLFLVSGKRYPRIPSDENHRGIAEVALCMDCHGPDKKYPRKPHHPPKDECFKCHKVKRTARPK